MCVANRPGAKPPYERQAYRSHKNGGHQEPTLRFWLGALMRRDPITANFDLIEEHVNGVGGFAGGHSEAKLAHGRGAQVDCRQLTWLACHWAATDCGLRPLAR